MAVIDSGIDYTHPDLAANMFHNPGDCNQNGIDDDGNGFADDCFGIDVVGNDSDPKDEDNHGMAVAGIIGAVGNNGIGITGINWSIQLMACRFLDSNGIGSASGGSANSRRLFSCSRDFPFFIAALPPVVMFRRGCYSHRFFLLSSSKLSYTLVLVRLILPAEQADISDGEDERKEGSRVFALR